MEQDDVRLPLVDLREEDVHRVHQDGENAELGGTEAAVGQAVLPLEIAVDVDVHAEDQVGDQDAHHEGQVHERGEPHAGKHDALVDDIHVVVDEEAVGLPLGVPHAGEAAVQRVAEPVHHEAEGGEPEPVQVEVRQGVAGRDDNGADKANESELVRRHPGGHPLCQPDQNFLFVCVEDRCLDPFCLLDFFLILSHICFFGIAERQKSDCPS